MRGWEYLVVDLDYYGEDKAGWQDSMGRSGKLPQLKSGREFEAHWSQQRAALGVLLNDLGRQGWELMNVHSRPGAGTSGRQRWILKRPSEVAS
jgi:hypothetical protein